MLIKMTLLNAKILGLKAVSIKLIIELKAFHKQAKSILREFTYNDHNRYNSTNFQYRNERLPEIIIPRRSALNKSAFEIPQKADSVCATFKTSVKETTFSTITPIETGRRQIRLGSYMKYLRYKT